MSQILRLYKVNVPVLARSYRRSRGTHYDTLGISPNATQREIKAAFFKLSKKMHPDATGKMNHADFVKINEAYSVLSKQRTKQQYDMSLRNPYVHRTTSGPRNSTYYTYDDLRAAYGFPDPQKTYRANPSNSSFYVNPTKLCFILLIFGIAFHLVLLYYFLFFNSKMLLKRSAEIEKENKRRIAIAQSRTPEEQEAYFQYYLREHEEREQRDRERLAMAR